MNFVINGMKWNIIEKPTRSPELLCDGRECYGTCWRSRQEIYLDESIPEDRKLKTLQHELAHAFMDAYVPMPKDEYTEEDMCEFVGLYAKEISDIALEYMQSKKQKANVKDFKEKFPIIEEMNQEE